MPVFCPFKHGSRPGALPSGLRHVKRVQRPAPAGDRSRECEIHASVLVVGCATPALVQSKTLDIRTQNTVEQQVDNNRATGFFPARPQTEIPKRTTSQPTLVTTGGEHAHRQQEHRLQARSGAFGISLERGPDVQRSREGSDTCLVIPLQSTIRRISGKFCNPKFAGVLYNTAQVTRGGADHREAFHWLFACQSPFHTSYQETCQSRSQGAHPPVLTFARGVLKRPCYLLLAWWG